jgi:hypothetical protein
MIIQLTFYFRFLRMLLPVEVGAGVLLACEIRNESAALAIAVGAVIFIAALGVRYGFLRNPLLRLARKVCADPQGCRKLQDACEKKGKPNVHTAEFIRAFENAWKLPKNDKTKLLGYIGIATSAGAALLLYRALSFLASQFNWPPPEGISVPDKVALYALLITVTIISGSNTIREGKFPQLQSVIFAVQVLLIFLAAFTCEGVLHHFLGSTHITKTTLHFLHEILIASIAFFMMVSDILAEHKKKAVAVGLHLAMLIALAITLYIEWHWKVGLKAGQLLFTSAIVFQSVIHSWMHGWDKLLGSPGGQPPDGEPPRAFAQQVSH